MDDLTREVREELEGFLDVEDRIEPQRVTRLIARLTGIVARKSVHGRVDDLLGAIADRAKGLVADDK